MRDILRLDATLETDPPGTVSLSSLRAEDADLLGNVEAPPGSASPLVSRRPLSLRSSCRGLEGPYSRRARARGGLVLVGVLQEGDGYEDEALAVDGYVLDLVFLLECPVEGLLDGLPKLA